MHAHIQLLVNKVEDFKPEIIPEINEENKNSEEDFVKNFEISDEKQKQQDIDDYTEYIPSLGNKLEMTLTKIETVLRAENCISSLLTKDIEFPKLKSLINKLRIEVSDDIVISLIREVESTIMDAESALQTTYFIKNLSPNKLFQNIIESE